MLSIILQRSLKHSLKELCKHIGETNALEKQYYFAYGGNLDPKQFSGRVPGARYIGLAELPGFKLEFSMPCEYLKKGYASVAREDRSSVFGAAFELSSLQLKLLDTLEWVPFGAYKRVKVKIKLGTIETEAFTYQARYPKADLVPSKVYLNSMIGASERHGFPLEYLTFLKNHPFQDSFELDHEFCLIAQGLKRHYPKSLKRIVTIHDKLREKLCELI